MIFILDRSSSSTNTGMFKAGETLTSFFLEDFAQVGLQYFYFEKFRFRESILIAFVTAFMELKRICYKKNHINNISDSNKSSGEIKPALRYYTWT